MNGFVIGKFCPPHVGHDYLIQTALGQTEALTIIVCGKKSQPINPILRVQWLQKMYPTATVKLLNQDTFDDTSEKAWTAATKACLGTVPDLMFSSEDYGNHYAELLGCQHVLVDRDRLNFPISASKIMANLSEGEVHLIPPARAWFRQQGRP